MARVYEVGNESNFAECPGLVMDPDPTIQSIEILDGSDTCYVNGEAIQYVNLLAEQKFIDGNNINNLDRLGRNIRVKVIFDMPGFHDFQIEIVPDVNNIQYSANEKASNENYKYEDQVLAFSTDENGEKIIDGKQLFLDVAGNNKYQFKAKDCNEVEVTSTATIKTMRMLYYSEARMQNLTSIMPTVQLASVEAEYLKHGIKLVRLNTHSIPLMENVDKTNNTERNTFFRNVAMAASQDKLAKMPFYFTIAYTGHLAKKGTTSIVSEFTNVSVGQGTLLYIGQVHDRLTNNRWPLWYNITANDTWYVDCYFLPAGQQNIVSNRVSIPKTRITPIRDPRNSIVSSNGCDAVEIDVSFLPVGIGDIFMEVHKCIGFTGGIGQAGGDIITICTKAEWQAYPHSKQVNALIHEIGHMLGMTSDGVKRNLDMLPTRYSNANAPSHSGDHCYFGITAAAPYDTPTAKSQASCVMYGAVTNNSSFCAECANRVRKSDLTTL